MNSLPERIKIGVFSKPLDNWMSGSGHHLDEMMRHILDLNDSEGNPFEFTFIHYKKSENPVYSRVKELLIPRNPLAASSVIRKLGFSILHYSPLSIYAPMFRIKAKKIATIHGAEEVIYPQGYSLIARLHEKWVMPILARRLDRIATVSETSKNYYVSVYKVPDEKIFLTVNGVSPEYHVLDKAALKVPEKLGITNPYIFHISRYSMRKNPEGILGGFSVFSEKHPEFRLVCAGKGWDGEEVRGFAREFHIEDKLITPGFVSETDCAELLNGASAFLFPSFAEGFGMPNVEAMACGCPVVTSSVFAIPEVVGDAAVLLKDERNAEECGAALEHIVTDKAFAAELVRRGLERVKRYDWNRSAAALMKVYHELAEAT
ncbi:glycosyltransferase family 4 protein [Brucepastera parasyntrophica]|uniref:glycosyltransferase family 4 protein n=1 Tax=Brucepastera parasyntrophica TaxID=2880008 RepID=UPI00210BD5D2|nr:glycosyltransferase family 1 protein [Brucepastera parasyntrophica]ULQ60051.1 glycosyltransferase family 4 protein [Brucepastera parasyntrophica]